LKGLIDVELTDLERLVLAGVVRLYERAFASVGADDPTIVSPKMFVALFSAPRSTSRRRLCISLWPGRVRSDRYTTSVRLRRSDALWWSKSLLRELGRKLESLPPPENLLPPEVLLAIMRCSLKLYAAATAKRGKRPGQEDKSISAMVEAERALLRARHKRGNAVDNVAARLRLHPVTVRRAMARASRADQRLSLAARTLLSE
jgi:hypothetical protein